MSKATSVCIFIGTIAVCGLRGQDAFQNLDFESAQLVISTNSGGLTGFAAADALPGWTVFIGTNELSMVNENIGIAEAVNLVYSNSVYVPSGNFAVALRNGEFIFDASNTVHGPGSISQTGLVPANAESLLFDMGSLGGTPQISVSLDGQDLSYEPLSSFPTYTVYGADISSFAGSEETLTFSAIPGAAGGILDDIQFSSMIVPEPSMRSLACVSGGIFICVLNRTRKRRRGGG
jgi:hypothetical protein